MFHLLIVYHVVYPIKYSNSLKHIVHNATCPANTIRLSSAVSVLGHRLRRWPNTDTALDKRIVFAGWANQNLGRLIS